MSSFFLWTYDRLSRHRLLLLTLWAAVLVVALLQSSRIRLKEDIGDFLSSDSLTSRYVNTFQQIGGQDRIVLTASASAIDDADARVDSIADALYDFEAVLAELDTEGIVGDVRISVNESAVAEMVDFVLDNGPLLLTADDYRRADSLLATPGYIAQALEANREQLSLPTSSFAANTIRRDPLHLFAPALARLQTLRAGEDYVVEQGIIFTPDRRAGLGFVTSPFGTSDSGNNRHLGELLEAACSRLHELHPAVSIAPIGAPLISVTNADRIRTDGLIAGILSVVLIALLLWYAFRRTSDIVWMVLSLVTGYAVAVAMMSLYRHELSVIVLGTSSVLIGIAANYPLHFLGHLRHEPDRRRALADMVPPLLTGNITTVSAFACLAWMDSEAMRDLGIMGALDLVSTILFVLVCLPVLAARRRPASAARRRSASAASVSVGDGSAVATPTPAPASTPSVPAAPSLSSRLLRSPLVFALVVLATCLLGWQSLSTTFDTNMQHINYMTDAQRENIALLNVGLEAADARGVLFVAEGPTADAALLAAEQMADSLRADGIGVKSLAGLVPSTEAQARSLDRWRQLLDSHGAALRRELTAMAPRYGFTSQAFQPFLDILAAPPVPQPVSHFSPILDVAGSQFLLTDADAPTAASVRVVTYATPAAPMTDADKDGWRQRLSRQGFVFDSHDLQSTLATTLSDNFNYIGFVCGFVVFVFLWLSFGSIELSLLSFLPLAVGWVWILGIMQLLGIQFNVVNIILATFIFGQGDDYTIFITEGLLYEHTYGRRVLRSYTHSVILSALIMFIGIGTLIFAQHPAMRSLAEVVIVGMATVVLMAFYLPPLVFRWLTTEKGQPREVPLTLQRVAFTVYASTFYLVVATAYQLFAFVWSHVGRYTEARKLFFHRTLCRISRFCIEHVPGTTWSVSNPHGETLERPAIIVCNHQSQLDLMAVLSIAPKVVILTKKWVWNNPLYGLILRAAEFYPVSDGVEETDAHLQDLVRRGYSVVIFPEGTRSRDRQIHRFHKGAFEFARAHGIDILPVCLTGLGHVLPKDELAFRRGTMHMEIGRRMRSDDPALGTTSREATRYFHQLFLHHYPELRRRFERTADVVPYVRYQYKYKMLDVKRAAYSRLDAILQQADRIDSWNEGPQCHLPDCGQGELAYVFALVHPDVQVLATDPDPDNIAVATHVNITLPNLRFELASPPSPPPGAKTDAATQ